MDHSGSCEPAQFFDGGALDRIWEAYEAAVRELGDAKVATCASCHTFTPAGAKAFIASLNGTLKGGHVVTASLTIASKQNIDRMRPFSMGSITALVKAAGCGTWSMYWENLTPKDLAAARALGLKVLPWTVNERSDMSSLIDLGVDGIITDYPDRLREVMAEKQERFGEVPPTPGGPPASEPVKSAPASEPAGSKSGEVPK